MVRSAFILPISSHELQSRIRTIAERLSLLQRTPSSTLPRDIRYEIDELSIRSKLSRFEIEKRVREPAYGSGAELIKLLTPDSVASVSSDVHLGTRYSNHEEFYDWLKSRPPGQTVVLLGDILDFWIFSRLDRQDSFVNRIVAEWERLWNVLSKLNAKGTELHYVPGNHDAFVDCFCAQTRASSSAIS
jgi:Calcineurin-like phosphoesterase